MIRRAGISLAVLATVGLAGCLGARPVGLEVRHYKTDPSLSFKPVTIQELNANPSQIGLHVQFTGIFNKMDEPFWQAFYTGFKQEDCKSFSAWPPEAAVWDPNGRGSAIGTLFIRNDAFFLAAFSKTAQYTPISIKGVVRNDFEHRPWIEVVDIDLVGTPIFSKEGLASLYVGLSEVRDKPAAAQQNLTRALNGTLSAAGRAAAWNGMAWIAHSARNHAQAEEHYSNALKAHPENDDAKEGIWRARNKMEPKAVMLPRSSSSSPTPSTTEGNTKELEKTIAERDELKTQLETLKNGAKEALLAEADKVKRATEQAKTLSTELEDVRKKLADAGAGGARAVELEAKVKSLEADMGKAWEKVKAADAETAELKKRLENAGGDAAKITELEGKVKTAEAAVTAAADKVKATETERDELKKRLEDAGGDAAKITELEGKVKTAEAAATAAADKAKATETERDELKKRLENAGGDAAKVTELEGKLKTAEAAVTAAADKVKATETERDELKKRLENAGGDAAKVTELEGKLKTAETERDDLKKKLAEAGTGGDTEALKKQIADKDTEIKTLTEKIAAVEKDAMAAAEAKLKAENEARVAEFEQKVKDRDETIKKLREEIDRLAEELKKKGG